MGWFREKASSLIRNRSDGITSTVEVDKLINDAVNNFPEFYELEPAEVIQVYLEETDLPFIPTTGKRDWSLYGYIRCRELISSKRELNLEEEEEGANPDDPSIVLAAPLEANIKDYPLPGEVVIVMDYIGQKYYTQKVNKFNAINNNSDPGISTEIDWTTDDVEKTNELVTKNFKYNGDVKEILASEGDITFNGRFGQSIRFGSNNVQSFDGEGNRTEKTEKDNQPNIIMRAGQGVVSDHPTQPVVEDVDLDGSSLYLTTDEIVPLTHHKSKVKELDPKFKTESGGNQIILTSDRLVFNSRKDTFLYSNNDINLVSKNRIVLEAHENVYLGSAPSQGQTTGYPNGNVPLIQPVLLGDTTIKIISDLMQSIITFAMNAAPTMGTCVGFPIPLDSLAPACTALINDLGEAKVNLEKAKSTKVHVVKE
tara:strand:+ start:231 stop:1505 length:1275 start_codon:yes stop_codon:yes gene_type:complete